MSGKAVSTQLTFSKLAILTYSNVQRRPDCNPSIVHRQSHPADTQNPILPVQLISVAGGIDDLSDHRPQHVNIVIWQRSLLPITFWSFDIAHLAPFLKLSCFRDRILDLYDGNPVVQVPRRVTSRVQRDQKHQAKAPEASK